MLIGSIVSAGRAAEMAEGLVENAKESNFFGKLVDGIGDLFSGDIGEGIMDIASATAEQVFSVEFLGLAATGLFAVATGPLGMTLFGIGAAGGLLAGWFKDDKPKAPPPQPMLPERENQVSPEAQGDLREIGADQGDTCAPCPPAQDDACGPPGSHGTGGGTHVVVHNHVSFSTSVESSVHYDSGAYATGGVHASGSAHASSGTHATGGAHASSHASAPVGKDYDLKQTIDWSIEHGLLTEEEVREATYKWAKLAGGKIPIGFNPNRDRDLAILLEKKLKSDPAARTTFESRFGEIDFSKDPIDNGFIYLKEKQAPAPTPAPVYSAPSAPPPGSVDRSRPPTPIVREYIPEPRAVLSTGEPVRKPQPTGPVSSETRFEFNFDFSIEFNLPVRDPNRFVGMSPEQIVRQLMMELMQDADAAMVATARELKDAQEAELKVRQAKANGENVSEADELAARQNVTQLESDLQEILNKRKQTFELLSHFSANNHEMAKTAIGNIGRV